MESAAPPLSAQHSISMVPGHSQASCPMQQTTWLMKALPSGAPKGTRAIYSFID